MKHILLGLYAIFFSATAAFICNTLIVLVDHGSEATLFSGISIILLGINLILFYLLDLNTSINGLLQKMTEALQRATPSAPLSLKVTLAPKSPEDLDSILAALSPEQLAACLKEALDQEDYMLAQRIKQTQERNSSKKP